MSYFNFSSLIRKYSCVFTAIIENEGEYDEQGDYRHGKTTEMQLTGAIISFAQRKVHRSEGKLSEKDMHLFMTEKLPRPLLGAEIVYKGNKYKVESETENADFTGVFSYVLKWVSAFV
jgi:hypothetical protein